MTSFALLFLAFGVGLDPRQGDVFGPALSPILACLPLLVKHDGTDKWTGRLSTRALLVCFRNREGWLRWCMYVKTMPLED
jgi:hypothetical protein